MSSSMDNNRPAGGLGIDADDRLASHDHELVLPGHVCRCRDDMLKLAAIH